MPHMTELSEWLCLSTVYGEAVTGAVTHNLVLLPILPSPISPFSPSFPWKYTSLIKRCIFEILNVVFTWLVKSSHS